MTAVAREPGTAVLRSWAFTTGYLGIASFVAGVLFFALSDPFGARLRTWSWLGPANDVLSVVFAATMIVAVVLVWREIARGVVVAVLTLATCLLQAWGALVTVRMLMGAATLNGQFAAAIPALVVTLAWWITVGVVASRAGTLNRLLTRSAVVLGITGLVGFAVFGVGLLLPAGSPSQWVAFIVGGVCGGAVYALLPVWWIVLGRPRL